MTTPDTPYVPVLCITLPILPKNDQKIAIENRPSTVMETV